MVADIVKEIELHLKLVNEFKEHGAEKVIQISEVIIKSLKSDGKIYLCGNGGSAADAQHVAGELMGRFHINRRSLPAISLSTDTSVLTCVGNDYGFNEIFARQVKALMKVNDLLWVFTTSGKSQNILAACEEAKKCGAKVIAFTGKSENKLSNVADYMLNVESEKTDAIQEIHQLAYHLICGLVEERLFQN